MKKIVIVIECTWQKVAIATETDSYYANATYVEEILTAAATGLV